MGCQGAVGLSSFPVPCCCFYLFSSCVWPICFTHLPVSVSGSLPIAYSTPYLPWSPRRLPRSVWPLGRYEKTVIISNFSLISCVVPVWQFSQCPAFTSTPAEPDGIIYLLHTLYTYYIHYILTTWSFCVSGTWLNTVRRVLVPVLSANI